MYGLIGILSLGLFLVFYFTNKNNVMDMTRIKKAYSLVGLQLLYFIS